MYIFSRVRAIYWIGQRQFIINYALFTAIALFVPLQRQQRDKLSPEAVELAQTLPI